MLDYCNRGFSLTAYAGHIGVSRDTLSEWASVHPEFSAAVRTAKAMRARAWEQRACDVGENGGKGAGQAAMIMFMLKNHAPEEFKDKLEHELTVSDEFAQLVHNLRHQRVLDDPLTTDAEFEVLPGPSDDKASR